MRLIILIFSLFLFSIIVEAQSNDEVVDSNDVENVNFNDDKFYFKIDAASFLNETILLGIEKYLIKERLSLHTDLGYLYSSKFTEDPSREFFGYSLAPQIRFYSVPKNKLHRQYLALRYRYKFGQSQGNQAVGIDCDDEGNCDFLQEFEGKATATRMDLQLHYGRQLYIYDHLYVESDFGIGWGKQSFDMGGVDGRLIDTNIHMDHERNGWGINLSLALRLVFVLN